MVMRWIITTHLPTCSPKQIHNNYSLGRNCVSMKKSAPPWLSPFPNKVLMDYSYFPLLAFPICSLFFIPPPPTTHIISFPLLILRNRMVLTFSYQILLLFHAISLPVRCLSWNSLRAMIALQIKEPMFFAANAPTDKVNHSGIYHQLPSSSVKMTREFLPVHSVLFLGGFPASLLRHDCTAKTEVHQVH